MGAVLGAVLAAAVGYLLGSVSSAVLVSKAIEKKDIRSMGSGNAGATNMARVFGWGAGAATFLCDIAKTAAAMLIGRLLGGGVGYVAAGAACLLGHCFPLYFGFHGGKGITVGATVALMLTPWYFLMLVAVFAVTVAISRRVSAASVLCAAFYPFAAYLAGIRAAWMLATFAVMGALVIFMHRSNIKRLLNGIEPVFKAKK